MPIGGTSYQPLAASTPNGVPRPQITPQEAVRILSLRLPKSPQNLPVPSALLTAQGGGGAGNLTSLLQALMRVAGGQGSREVVDTSPVPAVDNGLGGSRSFAPRITIGDQGGHARVDDPPSLPTPDPVPDLPVEDSPLFDAGIPRGRFAGMFGRKVAGTGPLF